MPTILFTKEQQRALVVINNHCSGGGMLALPNDKPFLSFEIRWCLPASMPVFGNNSGHSLTKMAN